MRRNTKTTSAKPAAPPLAETEWNFDGLPDNELIACCYWEYARESIFIRDALRHYRDWIHSGGLRSEDRHDCCNKLECIQSIGYVSEVFVRGCAFPAHGDCQSNDPEKANFRHPGAPPLTGSFPTAWQLLSEAERKSRARVRSNRTVIPLAPFKRGDRHDAQNIANWTEGRWNQIRAAYEEVRQEYPEASEVELIREGKLEEFTGVQPSLYWEGGGEMTVVSIEWSEFTNEELVQGFRRWVRANRPKHLGKPDARGHKIQDWRARLTRLAVMRLLSRFTALGLVADDCVREIWQTKQFSGRKWGDVTKWHDARREAREVFQKLFPFLPAEESPLSWKRLAPAK